MSLTREQISLHYLMEAQKVIRGKSAEARHMQLSAAYDMACGDLEKLLAQREEKRRVEP